MTMRATPIERLGTHSDRAAVPETVATKLRGERSGLIEQLEAIITRDVGNRGLASADGDNLVTRCRGNLGRAARHLAAEAGAVAIVTGFYVASTSPTIETDGPCGAIALAWLLARQGFPVTLVTDPPGASAIEAGLRAAQLEAPSITMTVFPFEDDDPHSDARNSNDVSASGRSLDFIESFFRFGPGAELTHLIAVERAGPNHTAGSPGATAQAAGWDFEQLCPLGHQNQVHNFRGEVITPFTAKTHLLFDYVRANKLPIRTIGVGDGGNEIGMGSIPWPVLHANIRGGLGARIACRVATDWTIACGVSNWGAYALGTAVAQLRERAGLLAEWTDQREHAVLAALVRAGAVDGVTGQPTLSVDGLPLQHHLVVWSQIRDAVTRFGEHM
jgi:hypothetical protein